MRMKLRPKNIPPLLFVFLLLFACEGPMGPQGEQGTVIHAVYGNLNDVQVVGTYWRILLPEEFWVEDKLVQAYLRTTEDAEWQTIALGYDYRVSLHYVHIYYNAGYIGYDYKILIIM